MVDFKRKSMGLITNPINRVKNLHNVDLGGNFEAEDGQVEGN
jgi:hypothetical protein